MFLPNTQIWALPDDSRADCGPASRVQTRAARLDHASTRQMDAECANGWTGPVLVRKDDNGFAGAVHRQVGA